jgi:hypothetical protein
MVGILDIAGYESNNKYGVREEKAESFSVINSVVEYFGAIFAEREREK